MQAATSVASSYWRSPARLSKAGCRTVQPHNVLPARPLQHDRVDFCSKPGARSLVCHYTSVKERLGDPEPEPEDGPKGKDSLADVDNAQQQGSSTASPTGSDKPSTTSWRVSDAADQRAATSVLKGIEAAAVAANPEQAGHPEQHMALRTEDYSADAPGSSDQDLTNSPEADA